MNDSGRETLASNRVRGFRLAESAFTGAIETALRDEEAAGGLLARLDPELPLVDFSPFGALRFEPGDGPAQGSVEGDTRARAVRVERASSPADRPPIRSGEAGDAPPSGSPPVISLRRLAGGLHAVRDAEKSPRPRLEPVPLSRDRPSQSSDVSETGEAELRHSEAAGPGRGGLRPPAPTESILKTIDEVADTILERGRSHWQGAAQSVRSGSEAGAGYDSPGGRRAGASSGSLDEIGPTPSTLEAIGALAEGLLNRNVLRAASEMASASPQGRRSQAPDALRSARHGDIAARSRGAEADDGRDGRATGPDWHGMNPSSDERASVWHDQAGSRALDSDGRRSADGRDTETRAWGADPAASAEFGASPPEPDGGWPEARPGESIHGIDEDEITAIVSRALAEQARRNGVSLT